MKLQYSFLALIACLMVGCGAFRPIDSGSSSGGRRPGGSPTSVIRTSLVTHAQELMGTRYKYGGNTPQQGFDCSGFVRYLYNYEGLEIERVSRDQAKQGREVDPRDARPGDLIFFRRSAAQPVFHVSMIVDASPGALWVIHPTSSRGVIKENVLASSYWKPKIYKVKDMIK